MKKLLIALLAISPMANADAIYLGGVSKHFGSSYDGEGYKYNENHELVAIEYNNIFLGTMLNSYHARSYAVGYQYTSSPSFTEPIRRISIRTEA